MAPVDATDPRFEACGGTVDSVDATVAFRARDYQEHFPLMGRAPELETDDPAFAVVFAEGAELPIPITGQFRPREDQPPPPEDSSHRTVCIYVGDHPDGVANFYVNVDVALLMP